MSWADADPEPVGRASDGCEACAQYYTPGVRSTYAPGHRFCSHACMEAWKEQMLTRRRDGRWAWCGCLDCQAYRNAQQAGKVPPVNSGPGDRQPPKLKTSSGHGAPASMDDVV